jgi:hypothetical protein
MCVDGVCQCPPDYVPQCGQGGCASVQDDFNNCGACGNQCAFGETCCGGRCVSQDSAERFCDWCGSLGGWPQGCVYYEMCDRGLCVSSEAFGETVLVTTCPPGTQIPEIPGLTSIDEYIDFFEDHYGCMLPDEVEVRATSLSGELLASCRTVHGHCELPGLQEIVPFNVVAAGQDGRTSETVLVDESSQGFLSAYPLIIRYPSETSSSQGISTGQLTYAIKVGEHWGIWTHDFVSGVNAPVIDIPDSDQWAPAWSHDGSWLAYLSDEVDGTNQVWVMNLDMQTGQVTTWQGSESITYVAWSGDDSALIVTLSSGLDHRLVRVPVAGGEPEDYVPPSSSFAVTSGNGLLVYVTDNNAEPAIVFADEADPVATSDPYSSGDTPSLAPGGEFLAVQQGDRGSRWIELFNIGPGGGMVPSVPRSGDDSNPVWIASDHTWIAYVSSLPDREVVHLWRVGADAPAELEIAPHDQVWYLSRRFL